MKKSQTVKRCGKGEKREQQRKEEGNRRVKM